VRAIIDPNHSKWKNWGGITDKGGWIEQNNLTATIEWIDIQMNKNAGR
jgi:hypothetical protein